MKDVIKSLAQGQGHMRHLPKKRQRMQEKSENAKKRPKRQKLFRKNMKTCLMKILYPLNRGTSPTVVSKAGTTRS